jgi:predicted GNAT family acetyltransferase
MSTPLNVTHNEGRQRYEVTVDGRSAFSRYQMRGGKMVFLHTEVPEEFEGRGIGSAIARAALDDARRRNLSVVPLCPFIAAYIERHPEYADLVDGDQGRSQAV